MAKQDKTKLDAFFIDEERKAVFHGEGVLSDTYELIYNKVIPSIGDIPYTIGLAGTRGYKGGSLPVVEVEFSNGDFIVFSGDYEDWIVSVCTSIEITNLPKELVIDVDESEPFDWKGVSMLYRFGTHDIDSSMFSTKATRESLVSLVQNLSKQIVEGVSDALKAEELLN